MEEAVWSFSFSQADRNESSSLLIITIVISLSELGLRVTKEERRTMQVGMGSGRSASLLSFPHTFRLTKP
jgi:hypothetical protein